MSPPTSREWWSSLTLILGLLSAIVVLSVWHWPGSAVAVTIIAAAIVGMNILVMHRGTKPAQWLWFLHAQWLTGVFYLASAPIRLLGPANVAMAAMALSALAWFDNAQPRYGLTHRSSVKIALAIYLIGAWVLAWLVYCGCDAVGTIRYLRGWVFGQQ